MCGLMTGLCMRFMCEVMVGLCVDRRVDCASTNHLKCVDYWVDTDARTLCELVTGLCVDWCVD